MVWARTVKSKGTQWRWRIYVPTELRYRLHVKARSASANQDDFYQEVVLGPGELTITSAFTSDSRDGSSALTVEFPDRSFRFYVNLKDPSALHFNQGIGELSQSFDPSTNIDLIRCTGTI